MSQDPVEIPTTDTNKDGLIDENDVVAYGEPTDPEPPGGSPESEGSFGDPPPPGA